MLALLRLGSFRRYIIGSAISDTGTWMQVMAQGWVMSMLTNKAILSGRNLPKPRSRSLSEYSFTPAGFTSGTWWWSLHF